MTRNVTQFPIASNKFKVSGFGFNFGPLNPLTISMTIDGITGEHSELFMSFSSVERFDYSDRLLGFEHSKLSPVFEGLEGLYMTSTSEYLGEFKSVCIDYSDHLLESMHHYKIIEDHSALSIIAYCAPFFFADKDGELSEVKTSKDLLSLKSEDN